MMVEISLSVMGAMVEISDAVKKARIGPATPDKKTEGIRRVAF
jgi:hypothetical protein